MANIGDFFESTDETWEESGSLIYVYKCKICNEGVNGYARSTHLYLHEVRNEIPNE